MTMTSVSGHLLGYEFQGAYRSWTSCSPLELFDIPVVKECPKDFLDIKVSTKFNAFKLKYLNRY